MHQALLSFNAGEISPYLRHRVNLDKVLKASERLENFLPMPYGGVTKRPGLLYLNEIADYDPANGRMLPFTSSDGQRYLLFFTPSQLLIHRDDGSQAAVLPFLESVENIFDPQLHNLRHLQMTQINDVAFIVHSAIHPMQLNRYSDTNWELQQIAFDAPPLLDENTNADTTITVTGPDIGTSVPAYAAGTTYQVGSKVTYAGSTWTCRYAHTARSNDVPNYNLGSYYELYLQGESPPAVVAQSGYYLAGAIRLGGYMWRFVFEPLWVQSGSVQGTLPNSILDVVSSTGQFNPLHVGSVWKFSRVRTSDEGLIELSAANAAAGPTNALYIEKDWNFSTFGTWHGTWVIEQSFDGITWTSIRSYPGKGNRNLSDSGTVAKPCFLRTRWEYGGTAISNAPIAILEAADGYVDGYFRITEVLDSRTAKALALGYIFPETTELFSEGAFSKFQGYPTTCCLHENRLVFGGTNRRPVSLWLSGVDDFLNFDTGPDDSDPIFTTLSAPNSDPIRWLTSQRRLFVGTSTGEYVSGSETNDSALTPKNFIIRRYTSTGCYPLQPLAYADGLLFLGRNGGRLHEIGYSNDRGGYEALDLTRLAEHLTQPGITCLAYQQTREPAVWAVAADGNLLRFLYNRQEQITAWSKITTSHGHFREVAIFPSEDGDDHVLLLVERHGRMLLERIPAHWQEAMELGADWFHLDGISGAGTSIAVPTHLQGQDLWLVTGEDAQWIKQAPATITLPKSAEWQLGLPVVSRLSTLPIDLVGDSGTSQARIKRLHRVILSLFQSRGGKVWNRSESAAQVIPYPETDSAHTGWVEVVPDAGHQADLHLRVLHDDPYPFTVRNAVLRFELQEP